MTYDSTDIEKLIKIVLLNKVKEMERNNTKSFIQLIDFMNYCSDVIVKYIKDLSYKFFYLKCVYFFL